MCHVIVYVAVTYVTVTCNIMLNPNLRSQNKKINGKENKDKKEKQNK